MCTLVLLTLSSVVEFSLQTVCAGRAGVGENKEKQTRGWGSQDTLDCRAEDEGGLLFHNLLSKSPGYRRSFLCEVEQLRPQRFLVGDCYFHSVFYFLQTLRFLPLRLWKVLFWSKVWRRGKKGQKKKLWMFLQRRICSLTGSPIGLGVTDVGVMPRNCRKDRMNKHISPLQLGKAREAFFFVTYCQTY